MTESAGTGYFGFDTNIPQIQQEIARGLEGIISSFNQARGVLGGSLGGADAFSGLIKDFEKIQQAGVESARNIGREYRNALEQATGVSGLPGGVGTSGFGGDNRVKELYGRIQDQVSSAVQKFLQAIPAELRTADVESVVRLGVEGIARALNLTLDHVRDEILHAPTAAPSTVARAAVGNIQRPALSADGVFAGSAGDPLREARQGLAAVEAELRTSAAEQRRINSETEEAIRRASPTTVNGLGTRVSQTPDGPLAGRVAFDESTGAHVVNTESGPQAFLGTLRADADTLDHVLRNLTKAFLESDAGKAQVKQGQAQADAIQAEADAVAKQRAKEADERIKQSQLDDVARANLIQQQEKQAAAAQAAQEKLGAEIAKGYDQRLKAEQTQAAQADRAAQQEVKTAQRNLETAQRNANTAEVAAQKDRVAKDIREGRGVEAGGFQFPDSGETYKNGRLVTSFEETQRASDALAKKLEQVAAAEEEANKTPFGEAAKGFFGAGGRKRTGGASDIDDANPLNGLFETAGVVAKYEILGRGLFAVTGAASAAVKEFADLDQAVRQFNEELGSGDAANQQYKDSLENIATASGQSVVDALAAAQRGVAAFADEQASTGVKKQVGQDVATAATQNAVVTGQDTKDSTTDLIAIGRAYGLAGDQLTDVTNAVANAKESFGADSNDIQKGLASIAASGKQAGFSLTELTQVVGLVVARTGQGGAAVASNLQRIFDTLGTTSTQTNLKVNFQIDPGGTVKQEIENIGKALDGLSGKQQQQLISQLGGPKALESILPLLREQPSLEAAYKKAIEDSNAGDRERTAIIGSLAGQFRVIGAELKQLGLDIAQTGILTPLVLAVKALEPGVKVIDDLVQAFNEFVPGPIRETALAILEVVVALNALKLAREAGGAGIGGLLASAGAEARKLTGNPFTRSAVVVGEDSAQVAQIKAAQVRNDAVAAANAPGLSAAERQAANDRVIASQEALTAANLRAAEAAKIREEADTAAARSTEEATVAKDAETVSTEAQTAANVEDTVTTQADTVAKVVDATATDVEAAGKIRSALIGAASYLGGIGGAVGGAVVALLPEIIAAVAATYIVNGFVNAQNKNDKAFNQSDETGSNAQFVNSSSSDALRKQADSFDKSAKAIASASGGLSGSINGALNEAINGGNRGQAKEFDRNAARGDREAAANIEAARARAIETQSAGAFDLSSNTGITDGLAALVAKGADAQTQGDLLRKAIEQQVSGKGLLAGQEDVAGSVGAAQALGDIQSGIELSRAPGTSFDLGKGKNLGAVNQSTFADYLASRVPAALVGAGAVGTEPTADEVKTATDNLVHLMIIGLSQQGIKAPTGKALDILKQAAADAVQTALSTFTPGGTVTAKNRADFETKAGQLEGQAGQDRNVADLLSNGGNTTGAALDGARRTKDNLEKDRQDLVLAGATDDELKQFDAQTLGPARLAYINAKVADYAAQGALAQALINPFDKAGQLQQAQKTLEEQLKLRPNDPTLLAQQAANKNQQADQSVSDANALAAAGVDSRDTVGVANVAVTQAQNKLDEIVNRFQQDGQDPSGDAYNAAVKALADAKVSYAQAQTDSANTTLEASIGVNDKVGEAFAKARADYNQAKTDLAGQAKQAQDFRTAAEDFYAALIAQDKQNLEVLLAGFDPKAVVAQLKAQRKELLAQLKADQKKGDTDGAAQVQDLLNQNAQDIVSAGKTKKTSGVDPRDQVQILKDQRAELQNELRDTPLSDTTDRAALTQRLKQNAIDLKKAQDDVANAAEEASNTPGNQQQAAQTKIDEARRKLGEDKKGTADYFKDLAALKQAIQDQAIYLAQLANDQALAAIDPRDTVAEAQQKLVNDQRLRSVETDPDKQAQLDAQIKADQIALQQQQVDLANAQNDSTVFSGSALSGASAALKDAQNKLAADLPGTIAYYQDLKAVNDAQIALARATEEGANTLELLGSDTTNPVAVAQAAVDAAKRKLADDQKLGAPSDVINADQLALRQAQDSAQKTQFEQQLQDAQTNFDLGRISGAAYLQYLESQHNLLVGVKDKTRQQIDELNEVDQAIKSAKSNLQGQFNIGKIDIPTVYEVRKSLAAGGSYIAADQSTTTVSIFINGADTGMVTDILFKATNQPGSLAVTKKVG